MSRERSLFLQTKLILTEKDFKKILGVALTYVTSMSYTKIKALLYFLFYTGMSKSKLLKLTRKEIGERKVRGELKINKNVQKILNQYYVIEQEEKNAFNVTHASLQHIFHAVSKYYGYNVSVEIFRKSFVEKNKIIGVSVCEKM